MFYIKLDSEMNLVITSREALYCGDNLNQKIVYLLPSKVGDIDMNTATVYLSYIRADGTADIVLLRRMDEDYNETYFQYTFPVTCTLTRYAGQICSWLQIYSGPSKHPVIAKSGECMLQIIGSKNMDEYISDRNLSLIYDMQRYMEDKVEKAEATLNERIDKTDEDVSELAKAKADNIVFNEEDSTIQLVSTVVVENEETGEEETQLIPLGDPIYVRADYGRTIADMAINEDGELIVTFDDETIQNLGVVIGKDGSVYVPHVDEHKILTFTIESEPGELPDPVDMNPNDEWSDIRDNGDDMDSAGSETGYVWEGM